MRASRRFIVGASAISVALLACACARQGASTELEAPDASIEECDLFLASYEQCLDSLGPDKIAKERVEQVTASLRSQASKGKAARSALRLKCADNLSRLKTACR